MARHDKPCRFDPAYQTRQRDRAKAYHQRYQCEPLYAELVGVRKRISSRRSLIETTLNRVRGHERDLLELVRRRDQLTKLWAIRRQELGPGETVGTRETETGDERKAGQTGNA